MRKILFLLFIISFFPALADAQTATITWGTTYQTIDGFGASNAFGVNVAGINTNSLTDSQADMFFSPTAAGGIGLSFLRSEIPDDGSCAGTCSIPDIVTMTKAIARGAKVWATPWSPPASMKSNGSVVCDPGSGSLSGGSYSSYATYLTHYAQQLQSTYGISLYALSVQNEPDFCATYDGALWSAANFDTFIKTNLGPAFASAGLSTKIMLPEPGHSSELASYADTTMTDGSATPFVGIVATHDYDSPGTANPVNYTTGGKPLWETETADFGSPDASISSGLAYAKEIHDWLTTTGLTAWHAWWMVNVNGNNDNEGLIQADGTITKRFYAIGNFSRFVRPGYTRIDATVNPQSGVYISAFKNGTDFVIVAINQGGTISQTIHTVGFTTSSVTPIVTSSSLNLSQQANVPVSGSTFTVTLPAQSVTSFISNSSVGGGGGGGGGTSGCVLTGTLTWKGVIDPCRAMDWSNAGVPGGLPDATWSQCGSTIQPFSGPADPIINALSACGQNQYVLMACGNFNLSSGVQFPVSTTGHIVLRGSGANCTFVSYSGGVNCNGASAAICIRSNDGTYPGGVTVNTPWTAGYPKGSTQITLGSVAGITPNKTVLALNQCDTGYSSANCTTGSAADNNGYFICSTPWTSTGFGCNLPNFAPDGSTWRPNAWEMETVMVTAINPGGCGPTCVSISQPIEHPNWSAGQSPQAVIIQPVPLDGVENMALDGTAAGAGTDACIGGQDTWQVFVSGVKCTNSYRFGLFFLDSFHTMAKDNYIAHPNLSGGGFGDGMGIRINWGSDDLIQNNIIQGWKVSFVNDGPAPGDVFAYNYCINQLHAGSNDDFMWGGTFQHATGDDFQLFEGNACNQSQDDNIHGGHVNQVRHRNFFWGYEQCANGQCGLFSAKTTSETAIISSSTSRYSTFSGNVLGTPGFTNILLNSVAFGSGQAYQIGGGNGGTSPPLPNDPLAISTSMFWDNWDAATNGTVCNNSNVPTAAPTYPNPIPTLGCGLGTLPASYYLTGRPSWFGSTPWPAIGPDVSGGNVKQCVGAANVSGRFNLLAAVNVSQCNGSSLADSWLGHVNTIPAMACFFSMGGNLDGTNGVLPFDVPACYSGSAPTSPVASLSTTAVVFNDQVVGTTSSPVSVVITNSGTANMTISSAALSGTPFTISTNGCSGVTLTVGNNCTVSLTYHPTASGRSSGTLTFTDNASPSTQTVTLNGNGILVPPGSPIGFAARPF